MSQEIIAMIRQTFEEAYNKGNVNVLDSIIAADYQRHQPPMKNVAGLPAYKKFIHNVRSAYSGFEIRIDDIIVDGDKSVTRITLKGKHTGQAPTLQAPPTGKQIEMLACVVSYWKGGKVAEEWVYNDYLGLVQQFGVIPLPGLFA
jgi:predicted ester cyclase